MPSDLSSQPAKGGSVHSAWSQVLVSWKRGSSWRALPPLSIDQEACLAQVLHVPTDSNCDTTNHLQISVSPRQGITESLTHFNLHMQERKQLFCLNEEIDWGYYSHSRLNFP